MKKTITILAILLVAKIATAEDKKAPAPFQNSDIKRTLEDGTIQKFDGDEYMVVKRGKKRKPLPPVIITQTKKIYLKRAKRKNNLMLHAGYAPIGLSVHRYTVRAQRDVVLGLGYSRDFNDAFRGQVQILTNGSIIGGIGFNY